MNEQTNKPTKAGDLTADTLRKKVIGLIHNVVTDGPLNDRVKGCIRLKLEALGADRVGNLDPSKYEAFGLFLEEMNADVSHYNSNDGNI